MAGEQSRTFDFRQKPDRKVGFKLEGEDRKGRPVVYEFRCVPKQPAEAIILFQQFQSEEQSLRAADDYITATLVEEDIPKWKRARADRHLNMDDNDLVAVFVWLQEQYSDRPTQPPSGSANGRTTTGTGSEENSSSQAVG